MPKKITLEEKAIKEIADLLSHFLADTFVLYVQTLNFHWNMQGPQFYMYHKLLQEQYESLAEASDELAERIRMLGHPAPGSMAEFLKLATLKEAPNHLSMHEMVEKLAHGHETLVEQCHTLIHHITELNDQGSADLLTDRIRVHAKEAWLLRSHL